MLILVIMSALAGKWLGVADLIDSAVVEAKQSVKVTTGQAPAQGNNPPSANQPSGQPNQNTAPAPSTTGQPAQNPPNR